MVRPPYAFCEANRQRIEELAARRSPRPMAEPFYGAITVGFFAALIAGLALSIGGDPSLSDYRREGIATLVSFLAGGMAYLFLRSQHRAFDAAVEQETRELWAEQEARAQNQIL